MRISLRMWGIEVFDLEVETYDPIEVECDHEEDSRSLESVVLRDDSLVDPEIDDYAVEMLQHVSNQKRRPFGFRPAE